MEGKLGLYFKKNFITIDNEKIEYFEFKDVVYGINFINSHHNEMLHIVTGEYSGTYASILNSDENEYDDVVLIKDIDSVVESIGNKVDFEKMREELISKIGNYYVRNKKSSGLEMLLNNKIVNEIKKTNNLDSELSEEEKSNDEKNNISSMYSSIKKTIVSQDEQIKELIASFFQNQKVINSNLDLGVIKKLKENILINGSSGTGKKEILKKICKFYNIPIVIGNATLLLEKGLSEKNIVSLLEELYHASDENLILAQKGILVIEELDKLIDKPTFTHIRSSKEELQKDLLKLLNNQPFYFNDIKFDTTKITVVGLGNFNTISKTENLTIKDFIDLGLSRELVVKFSKIISMNKLEKEDMIKILLTSDLSPLNTYKQLFESMDINFEYTDEFVEWVVEETMKLKSGAIGLKTIVDECISSAMFEIFSGECTGISLIKPENKNDKFYLLEKDKEVEKKGFLKLKKK